MVCSTQLTQFPLHTYHISRTSSNNCAWIYNAENENIGSLDWALSFTLDTKGVSDAFYLYSLLDHHNCSKVLELLHHASNNADHLRPALEEQNLRMAGTGQPEWNHACELCTKVYPGQDGDLCEWI